jgi:hypothetical protein
MILIDSNYLVQPFGNVANKGYILRSFDFGYQQAKQQKQ